MNPEIEQPRKSRIFKALERYQASPNKACKGGRANKNPTKVCRVPLNFLEDLDTLVDLTHQQIAETSPDNPRYDRLKRFLHELEEFLPGE